MSHFSHSLPLGFLRTGPNVRRGDVVSGTFSIIKVYISLACCVQLAHNLCREDTSYEQVTSLEEIQTCLSAGVTDSSKVLSLVSALICRHTKMPYLTFAFENSGNLLLGH